MLVGGSFFGFESGRANCCFIAPLIVLVFSTSSPRALNAPTLHLTSSLANTLQHKRPYPKSMRASHGEAKLGGVSSLASSLASAAANSIKFRNERMIRAKDGLYTAALSAPCEVFDHTYQYYIFHASTRRS